MKQVYTLRQDTNILGLMDKVNESLDSGWRLQGGICVTSMGPSSGPMFLYTQAMVLEVETK
jgi:hypothetical protein